MALKATCPRCKEKVTLPDDKAGSYAIQNEAFHPVDRIEGSYTNVVGLPVEAVKQALETIGWSNVQTGTDEG